LRFQAITRERHDLMTGNAANESRPKRCVVVGAAGGIGGAFVEALCAMPGVGEVHAVSRTRPSALPAGAIWHEADILDENSLSAVAAEIGGELDLVIVATGMLHADGVAPEKDWRELNAEVLARVMAVNAIGPALVLKHFAPMLPRSGRSVLAVLSARVGSISDNRLGGWYAYRASKAALNQIIRTFSIELARKRPQAIAVGLHPGTVDTGLSAPFRGTGAQRLTPAQSAAHLLGVIAGLEREDGGRVFDWKGERVPE
jgi:NAD(P)-dependent dehydrogenase (short-subunit alcohol dehydrogenase family)